MTNTPTPAATHGLTDGLTTLAPSRMPSLGPAYRRALWPSHRPGLKEGQPLPSLRAEVRAVRVEAARLAAYRRVCGLPPGSSLPPMLPHVLAAGLHAELLLHPSFPLRALGMVHLGSSIATHTEIGADRTLDFVVSFGSVVHRSRGVELELLTDVTTGDSLHCRCSTRVLFRTARRATTSPAKPRDKPVLQPGLAPGVRRSTVWQASADLGFRYAAVSGDYNPIHLWPLTARLFGFRRPIAHGMWSLARALAEMDTDLPAAPFTTRVDFVRPIFLPSRVVFTSWRDGDGDRFQLTSLDGRTSHAEGRVTAGVW